MFIVSPEAKKAIELRDSLIKLLYKFNLLDKDSYLEVDVYKFIDKSEKLGFRLRGISFWHIPEITIDDLKNVITNIEKLTNIKLEYEIPKGYTYATCFLDIKYLDKLYDIIYPMGKIYC